MLHKWYLPAISCLARWLSEAPGVAKQYLLLNLPKLWAHSRCCNSGTSDVVHVPDVCKLRSGKKMLPIMYASAGHSLIALSSIFVKIIYLRPISKPKKRITPSVIALSCLGAYMTQLLVTRFVQRHFNNFGYICNICNVCGIWRLEFARVCGVCRARSCRVRWRAFWP